MQSLLFSWHRSGEWSDYSILQSPCFDPMWAPSPSFWERKSSPESYHLGAGMKPRGRSQHFPLNTHVHITHHRKPPCEQNSQRPLCNIYWAQMKTRNWANRKNDWLLPSPRSSSEWCFCLSRGSNSTVTPLSQLKSKIRYPTTGLRLFPENTQFRESLCFLQSLKKNSK